MDFFAFLNDDAAAMVAGRPSLQVVGDGGLWLLPVGDAPDAGQVVRRLLLLHVEREGVWPSDALYILVPEGVGQAHGDGVVGCIGLHFEEVGHLAGSEGRGVGTVLVRVTVWRLLPS